MGVLRSGLNRPPPGLTPPLAPALATHSHQRRHLQAKGLYHEGGKVAPSDGAAATGGGGKRVDSLDDDLKEADADGDGGGGSGDMELVDALGCGDGGGGDVENRWSNGGDGDASSLIALFACAPVMCNGPMEPNDDAPFDLDHVPSGSDGKLW